MALHGATRIETEYTSRGKTHRCQSLRRGNVLLHQLAGGGGQEVG